VLPDWFPPEQMLLGIIEVAQASLESGVACSFDQARGAKIKPYSLKSAANSPMQYISALVDHLRGFETDLTMVRCLASYPEVKVQSLDEIKRPERMPIYHCLDQHCRPDMAYYYTDQAALPPPMSNAHPFAPLFKAIFRQVTGFNPRRTPFLGDKEFEAQPFVAATRHAQRCSWTQASPTGVVERPCVMGAATHVAYSLHADWMFGMIGHIEVRVGRTDYIAIVKRDNPLVLEVRFILQ